MSIFTDPYKFDFKWYTPPKELFPDFPDLPKLSYLHMNPSSAASIRFAYSYLKQIFGWFPANPSKPAIVNKLNDVFEDMPYDQKIRSNTNYITANLIIQDTELYSDSRDELRFEDSLRLIRNSGELIYNFDRIFFTTHDIALMGVRGVGKTAFINKWLNQRTTFLESRKITWFRVDITKVLKLFGKTSPNSVEFRNKLMTYSQLHLVYVFLNYAGEFEEGDTLKTSELFKKVSRTIKMNSATLSAMSSVIINYRTFVHKNKSIEFRDISEKYISSIIEKSDLNAIIIEKFRIIYDSIVKYILENTISVAFILDGMDNISWSNDSIRYRIVCEAAGDFFKKIYTEFGPTVRRIMCIRPEALDYTHVHLNEGPIGAQNTYFRENLNFDACVIRPPNATNILNRKSLAALSGAAFRENYERMILDGESRGCSREELSNELRKILGLISDIIKGLESHISNKLESIDNRLLLYYKRAISSSIGYDQSAIVLDLLFDQDVRGFLNAMLETAITVRNLETRRLVNVRQADRYLQYLFLCGRPYFNSRSQMTLGRRCDYQMLHDVFPNIFWFDPAVLRSERKRWHGTVGMWILKLTSIYDYITIFEAQKVICGELGYSEAVFAESFSAFVAFGLIDSANTKKEIDGDSYFNYKITNKGKFMKKCFFDNTEMMYFYVFDIPFADEYVNTINFRLYRSFDFSEKVESFYEASIIPISIFYRHYYWQTKRDIDIISKSAVFATIFGKYPTTEIEESIDDLKYARLMYERYLNAAKHSKQSDVNSELARIQDVM